jgi:hypothetical protein
LYLATNNLAEGLRLGSFAWTGPSCSIAWDAVDTLPNRNNIPRLVWAACLVGLLLRLAWCLSRPADLSSLPDQSEYLSLGRSLLSGDGLSMADPRFPGVEYAYRTPGYPAMIALCGGSVRAVRIVQAFMDTGTALGVWLLARRLIGPGAAVSLALALACPFLIYFSGLVLTETLFTSMLVWGLWLLLSTPQVSSSGTWRFLGGLLVLSLAALVRPGALGLPILLGTVAAMTRSRLPGVPAAAAAAAIIGLVLLPWAWRNHRVLNQWVWTSTNAGITAYDGSNPAADGSSDQSFARSMPELAEMTETQRDDYLTQLAETYRHENPQRAWELAVLKAGRTWSPVPLSAEHRSWATWAAGAAYSAVAWGLAAVGVWRGRIGPGAKVLLLLPALYFTVGAILSVGSLRYRVPAEPFLAVLAGSGAAAIWLGTAHEKKGPDQPE